MLGPDGQSIHNEWDDYEPVYGRDAQGYQTGIIGFKKAEQGPRLY